MAGSFEIATLAERPDLDAAVEALERAAWPAFLLHGDVRGWRSLVTRFAEFQLALLEGMTDPGGLPLDPWVRTHRRMGGETLGVMEWAFTVTGTVKEWVSWTGCVFSASGRYSVPGALSLVEIDVEQDRGFYEEDNVWMRHPIPPKETDVT